jgi:predicted RNA-binding protein with PIN domain
MPFFFDGNNLIGQSTEQVREHPSVRRAFLQALSQCAVARGGKFTVFFDGDETDRIVPPARLQVRYSAPLSCDEAILRGLAGSPTPAEITVVTNDRALRIRCRDAGAHTMDWREFAARMKAGAEYPAGDREKEERVDVREWSRYFGIDPDSLR